MLSNLICASSPLPQRHFFTISFYAAQASYFNVTVCITENRSIGHFGAANGAADRLVNELTWNFIYAETHQALNASLQQQAALNHGLRNPFSRDSNRDIPTPTH